MKNSRKAMAIGLVVIFAAVMLFSHAFVALHTEHDCIGEHCHTCALISLCENVIRTVSGGAAVCAACFGAAIFAALAAVIWVKAAEKFTLVSLKVKLSF